MLEIIVIVAACIAMYKIAEVEGRAAFLWAGLTLLLCLLSLALPLPFIRVLIAAVLAFVTMFVVKLVAER